MVHCAYNSLWMGNFIHPDWDMFQSTHPCAEFHAASRAISGGPIYVSDTVGKHNFPLLKRLAMPDGTILRCEYYALPTRDCLFDDPLHDGKTMLKIWNLNKVSHFGIVSYMLLKTNLGLNDGPGTYNIYNPALSSHIFFVSRQYTGVIGAFNCQGGGWCRETRRNQCASQFSHKVTAKTNPKDIEWNSGKNPIPIEGVQVFAMYLSESKKLVLSKPYENIEITLEPFNFELITVSPVTPLGGKGVQFAPIGLVNMLNTGGAIQSLLYNDEENSVQIGVKGSGEMRVFASEKPRACKIDGQEVVYEYEGHMVVVQVPWSSPSGFSVIEYRF